MVSGSRLKPVVLAILDGWGYREAAAYNAIASARTPHWDGWWQSAPHALLQASELEVGLPEGQMGNSEVGHMNIGAGRVMLQDLPRINRAIDEDTISENPALITFLATLQLTGGACHLCGLFSDGGVHSHLRHLETLAEMLSEQGVKVWLHAFLDGRDVPPRSALTYLQAWETRFANNPLVRIATVSGRYYAMDRDKRWDRVEKAYRAIVAGEGVAMADARQAIEQSYAGDVSDEFVLPHVLAGYGGMEAKDGLLMANFRADRARQLLQALLESTFDGFARPGFAPLTATLGLVEYSEALSRLIPAMFPAETPSHTLGEVVADAGLKQLRIAETEKYPHVTFFFNGGREDVFAGEERILVPSPKVATYDLQPEMSAPEVTNKLVEAVASGAFDLIVVNYANTDMVGHSGLMEPVVKAVEAVDASLGRLEEVVRKQGGALLITADHGNAEQLYDESEGQPHTAHTLNPVPLLLVSSAHPKNSYALTDGRLADIAPTVLDLLQLPIPSEMTGRSLLARNS